MKKIIVFLFVLMGVVSITLAQPTITNRGKVRMTYSGDTTDMSFGTGSSKFVTSKDSFNFNKPIYVNKVPVGSDLGSDTVSLGIALSSAIKNGPWKWVTDKYTYYTDSTDTGAVGGFYLGSQIPTKTTQYNLNGRFTPTTISAYGTNSLTAISASSALNNTTPAISAASTIGGYVVSFNQTGVGSANRLMTLGRSQSSGNVTGDIIGITDNPSTGGTISGKVLSATIVSTERISLNPRIADGSSAVPYFTDTHNNLTTTGAKLWSFRNQGTEKASIDKDGQIISGDDTNNAVLSPTTGLRLNGSSTVFDDLQFPFQVAKQGTADAIPFTADSSYWTFAIDTTAPGVYVMYFTIQMPHTWKEGSTIYPHVHYKHETAIGTPNFIIKYKWYESTGTTVQSWNWYRMGNTTGTTNNTVQMSYGTGGISGSGKTISSLLICQLYLRAAPNFVNAFQFDIHIEKDALGSSTETAK